MSDTHAATILIVGAGIAGLTAAKTLEEEGLDVLVLDKGRSVGGRMATRRIGRGRFDHGTPYFTARHDKFLRWLKDWRDAGLVGKWSNGFPTPHTPANWGYARYSSPEGMTAVPKHLARGLPIHLQTQVTSVSHKNGHWLVQTSEDGEIFEGQGLLLTPPLPQSLALLDAGNFELPAKIRSDLEQIDYERCLVLMVRFAGPSRLPPPGGLRFPGGAMAFIGDSYQKGISPDDYAVTIHASPTYSRRRWEDDEEEIAADLLQKAADWLHPEAIEWQLHRWRYARPDTIHPQPMLLFTEGPPLALAGDAFGGPRVEAAALSGDLAAEALYQALQ